ncbi:MAG: hypothetical protein ACWGOL_11765 [Desulfuromonadales bacterium]
MFNSLSAVLAICFLILPNLLYAQVTQTVLETVASAGKQAQPDLQSYLVTIETPQIKEIMTSTISAGPVDVATPVPLVITKFWQRNGNSLVFARPELLSPAVKAVFKQTSAHLAIELVEMILPSSTAEQRLQLMKEASIKLSEVLLADNLIQRVEISFGQPTDLGQAFYAANLHLPQEKVLALSFDIDTRTRTIGELRIVTDSGLHLLMEIRYVEVPGGHIPERFQITSPDGKVDERLEVKFAEVEGFSLPASMLHVIRHAERHESLQVFFKNYHVNEPVPEDIQAQLQGLAQEK